MMKKFNNFLNENKGIPVIAYELILKGEKYIIVANAKDTQMQITFKEDGTKIDNFSMNELENEDDLLFKKLDYIPDQIFKSLKDMGAISGYSTETIEETKPQKKYSDMGQSELNYQLNIAIDNEDWEKAKEISNYLKESIVDKMAPPTDEQIRKASINATLNVYPQGNKDKLTEIVNTLVDNGYKYEGINIEKDLDEYYYKNNRLNEEKIVWFSYDKPEHYFSFTKKTTIPEIKERIKLYKNRYNL